MKVQITSDVDAFNAAAGEWLASRPVENSILLTKVTLESTGQSVEDAKPVFAWVTDEEGQPAGAGSWTPGYAATVTGMAPAAVEGLVRGMVAAGASVPGVTAPAETAEAFARLWESLTGHQAKLEREGRVYRCDRVAGRPGTPGQPRLAEPGDAELLTDWFSVATEGGGLSRTYVRNMVEEQLAGARLVVWEDGEPVGAAGYALPVHGVARPRPIYILPERRSSGYARALVWEVTARALQVARTCMSFVDLSFTPMVHLMDEVGYLPVHDESAYAFVDADTG